MDYMFSQHDLSYLDDIIPEKDKKKKEDEKKKKKGSIDSDAEDVSVNQLLSFPLRNRKCLILHPSPFSPECVALLSTRLFFLWSSMYTSRVHRLTNISVYRCQDFSTLPHIIFFWLLSAKNTNNWPALLWVFSAEQQSLTFIQFPMLGFGLMRSVTRFWSKCF